MTSFGEFMRTISDDDMKTALEEARTLFNGNIDADIGVLLDKYLMEFSFSGFDPRKLLAWLRTKEMDSKVFKNDIITCVLILQMRGNKLSKIIKKTESNGAKVMSAIQHKYNIKDGGKNKDVVTLARISACVPWIAPQVCEKLTEHTVPVDQLKIDRLVYPKYMMCATFASCVPKNLKDNEMILDAHKIHQHLLSAIINPNFKNMNMENQVREIDTYVRAAHNSPILKEEQRNTLMKDWGITDNNGAVQKNIKDYAQEYAKMTKT